MGARSGACRTSGCCEDGGVGDDGLRNMGRVRRAKGASNADMVWSHGLSRIESSVIISLKNAPNTHKRCDLALQRHVFTKCSIDYGSMV